jgi:hypothetical protein
MRKVVTYKQKVADSNHVVGKNLNEVLYRILYLLVNLLPVADNISGEIISR